MWRWFQLEVLHTPLPRFFLGLGVVAVSLASRVFELPVSRWSAVPALLGACVGPLLGAWLVLTSFVQRPRQDRR